MLRAASTHSLLQHNARALFGASVLAVAGLVGCGGDDDDAPVPPAGAAGKAGSSPVGGAGGRGGAGGVGGQSGRGGRNADGGTGQGGNPEGGRAHGGSAGEGGEESSGGSQAGAAGEPGSAGDLGSAGESGAAGEAGQASGVGGTAGAGTSGCAGIGGANAGSAGTDGMGGLSGGTAGTGGDMGGSAGTAGSGGTGSGGSSCVFVTPEGDDALAASNGGTTPFRNLQPAIDHADTHRAGPNQICVAYGPDCSLSASYPGPVGGRLEMRSGISVYGGYESTTFTRCPVRSVTLRPGSEEGVYFGPSVNEPTVLDGFVIERFSATTTAGITIDGAENVTLTNVEVAGAVNATTAYGVDAKNGAAVALDDVRVTIAASDSASSRPANQIGFRSVGAVLTANRCQVMQLGTSATGVKNLHAAWLENSPGSRLTSTTLLSSGGPGARVQGLFVSDSANVVLDGTNVLEPGEVGRVSIGNGAKIVRSPGLSWRSGAVTTRSVGAEHGIWLEDSPGATIDVSVGLSVESALAEGIHVHGSATGSRLAGSLEITGPLSAGAIGVGDCSGSAFELDTSVLVRVAPSASADGIRVAGDCRPTISSDVTLLKGTTNRLQTLTGIRCSGGSRCTIDGSDVEIIGAGTLPGAVIDAVGVWCESGSCPTITRSHISGLSQPGELRNSRYRGGGVFAPGATLISGNMIEARCSGGGGIGLHGSGRIENNVIHGPNCGGSFLDVIAHATGLSVDADANVHSNTIWGGGALDGVAVGQVGCTSTGIALNAGLTTFRNNIVIANGCTQSRAFVRTQPAAQPNAFERNDLVSSVLYVDEATTLTDVDAVNALFGPTALNFSADPQLNGIVPSATSPCIDAGTTTDAPDVDYLGEPRDTRPDVGAVEYQGSPPPDPCDGVTCSGHGSCERQGAQPVCICDLHFGGPDCAAALDCSTDHGGCDPLTTCSAGPDGIVCGPCPSGYSGDGDTGCVALGACAGVACEHGGRCLSGDGEYACLCPQGITGKHCELTFTQLSGADQVFCGTLSDGSVRCWGRDRDAAQGNFQAVSVGDFPCALGVAGELVCWNLRSSPPPPPGAFRSLEVGYSHACAIRMDGSVECWGSAPTANPSDSFAQVAIGSGHSCGIRTDGTLACWGVAGDVYADGQLDPPSGTFKAIAAHAFGTCAIDTGGAIHCWGQDAFGGHPPPTGSFQALDLAATSYGCALRDEGSIACWGPNSRYVHPPTGTFSALAVGHIGACALRDDLVLVCWGYPGSGPITPPNGDFSALPNPCSEVSCDQGTCSFDGAVACSCWNAMRRPGDDALRCDPDPCWYDNGGCDVLTSCIATDAGAICTECPSGYLGDGETGCVPASTGLDVVIDR
jgi:hypothetical protein